MAKLSTLKNSVNPLTWNVSITNPDGTPNDEFMRKWAQQAKTNAAIPDLTTTAGMSARLDLLGSTPGMLLERGATYWAGLASPANAAKFLNGANFPAYAFVKDSDLALTDITTNNVTNLKHGFAPKSPADVTTFLNGGASPAYAQVKDSDLSLSDITTNDVSITKHGFVPKAPNDSSKFLNGVGAWAIPAGGGSGGGAASIQDDGTNVYIALSDTDGQLVLDGSGDPIFSLEVFPPASLPIATAAAFGVMKPDGTTITAAAGVMSAPAQGSGIHLFQVGLSSAFVFAETTVSPILYDTASIDPAAGYSPATGRYTPKKAGRWFFQAGVILQANSGTVSFGELVMRKNGASIILNLVGPYAAGGNQTPTAVVGTVYTMNGTTDFVDTYAYLATTGAAGGQILSGLGNGFFGFWIGP